ncbi:hypothetical protein TNCT_689731 [Trichonephila clavata]|uniref:Uncharacterized protein n=1 Tax=Trichonephila clavata TaxID=2740835 RepID=A0A8X6KMZ2_TRICU|nr:hypothetical protein TNCT_689731 [Trichonephila clavata]
MSFTRHNRGPKRELGGPTWVTIKFKDNSGKHVLKQILDTSRCFHLYEQLDLETTSSVIVDLTANQRGISPHVTSISKLHMHFISSNSKATSFSAETSGVRLLSPPTCVLPPTNQESAFPPE